jgi:hypothetical protein
MANYKYSADLVDEILFRAGEPTDGTSEFEAAALRYLNRAYQAVWMGGGAFAPEINEEWWWLQKHPPGALVLDTPVWGGTVSVTKGSTNITFSVASSVSLVGRFFFVTGTPDVFRIVTHTAGQTAAVLDVPYTGSTNSAASYKALKLEYDLASDVLRLIGPMRTFQLPTRTRLDHEYEITGMELPAMEKRYPLATTEIGIPNAFAFVSNSKVRFNRSPDTEVKIEYDYLYKPADLTDSPTEEPALPHEWRKLLVDIALFFILVDKNDNRADGVGLLARNHLLALAAENRHKRERMGKRAGIITSRPSVALLQDPKKELLGSNKGNV